MIAAHSVVEAYQKIHPADSAVAAALLSAAFESHMAEVTAADGGTPALTLHRFRLAGVGVFAIGSSSPLTLTVGTSQYVACAGWGTAFVIDDVAICGEDQAVIIAPGGRHRYDLPAGAVMIACLVPPSGMARYGHLASEAVGRGFAANGLMRFDLGQGPFRLLRGTINLVAAALAFWGAPAERPEAGALPNAPLVPRHVKRAEDYLVHNLAEPLTVTALAARVGVSVRSLHRGFLDFRGVTPARYLLNLRIEAAHRMMTSGSCALDLRQVAAAVGFGSYAPFWRAYVRKYGQPPSIARRAAAADQSALARQRVVPAL